MLDLVHPFILHLYHFFCSTPFGLLYFYSISCSLARCCQCKTTVIYDHNARFVAISSTNSTFAVDFFVFFVLLHFFFRWFQLFFGSNCCIKCDRYNVGTHRELFNKFAIHISFFTLVLLHGFRWCCYLLFGLTCFFFFNFSIYFFFVLQ